MMMRHLLAVAAVTFAQPALAQDPADATAFQHSVEQLRAAIGPRNVTTEFLTEDGSVTPSKRTIGMVSVGADGMLWIMTGPLGGEQRMSQEYTTANGTGRLRFTRFNVSPDTFESRMEYTEDGGTTWKPGNHQLFTRASPAGS